MLAGVACPGPPLQPDLRGTSRSLWSQRQRKVHLQEALGRSRGQRGLGSSRRPRGTPYTTEPGAARASLTRTRSASTIVIWTSSGSTPLNGLCPMGCPTTEEAPVAGGPRGRSRGAHRPRSGRHAARVRRAKTGPARASAPDPWLSAGTQGQQRDWTKEQACRPAVPTEASVRGGDALQGVEDTWGWHLAREVVSGDPPTHGAPHNRPGCLGRSSLRTVARHCDCPGVLRG